MKEVLIHGVMHTGGTFCRILLSSAYSKDIDRRKVIYKYEHSLSSRNIINKTLQGLTVVNNTIGTKCRFIASHHIIPGQPIFNMIDSNKCPLPVVTTLRDPLLVMNTLLWRYIYEKTFPVQLSKWRRLKEAERQVEVIKECIHLSKTNKSFLLPVDLEDKPTTYNMFDYCGIVPTEYTCSLIEEWPHKNITQNVIKKKTNRKQQHLIAKKAIQARDVNAIKKLLDVEFNFLQRQEDLKQQLETIGYRNLSWF